MQYHGGENSIKIDKDETYGFLITLGMNALCIKLANTLRCSIYCRCLHGLLQVNSSLELCYILIKQVNSVWDKRTSFLYKTTNVTPHDVAFCFDMPSTISLNHIAFTYQPQCCWTSIKMLLTDKKNAFCFSFIQLLLYFK